MGTRNHYWILDCIIALTVVMLGTTALCSFVGLAMPSLPGMALSAEGVLCGMGIIVGLLFAGYVWREHRDAARRVSVRALRAYQERHALMLKRVSNRAAEIPVVAPESHEPATARETPETVMATSFTNVKAERAKYRKQARRAVAVPVAA